MTDERDDPPSERPSPFPSDTSLSEVLQGLADNGFTGQFELDQDSGSATCLTCSTVTEADQLVVATKRRLEGASDPADMSMVLGLTCPACGTNGVLVCRYGPEASAGEAELLRHIRDINDGA
jgi:hypothetical protein